MGRRGSWSSSRQKPAGPLLSAQTLLQPGVSRCLELEFSKQKALLLSGRYPLSGRPWFLVDLIITTWEDVF